ncbi:NAD(P)/FAD-dependent oxidoreductase [Actinomadura alba]|uniref:FAD-dependent oxidoreductase n=1 Tax=Actinomadura alba TaxID=406431 RepID=A0ABR7LYN5_9ACTN|nr:FAD-dependent oxidoreductase [Actinomadura alba]MBC6469966.1 FAD-dependent oxidoreductase [Actinomadura alba]
MVDVERISGAPRSAIVVGAGVVGLSTAWFLQEHGVEVTVVDRTGVAAGASWGNAGWLSPGLAIPLNEPSTLMYGLRSLLRPTAPLHIPMTANPGLWTFLTRFAANCRWSSWTRAVQANLPLNEDSVAAFDALTANGVQASTTEAPITAAFRTAQQARGLLGELARMERAGQPVSHAELSAEEMHEFVPLASSALTVGVRIDGQRYLDPGAFVRALADSVIARGGSIEQMEVVDVRGHATEVTVRSREDTVLSADTAVIATGAWISRLLARLGVRVPVRAGRGYSFTVPVERPVPGPVYLPVERVACTPYQGALRVAGTMEFRGPDAPPAQARADAIVASARPLLDGVRWDERRDVWVGPRPVTPDGRPLIGALAQPGVYAAGGHGMWGLTQGPETGRLLAEQIITGKCPAALSEFDPLR